MEFNELLEQCKSKKLKTTLEKIYEDAKENGVDFHIYDDMSDTLFDVEIEEDYDVNVMAYFEPSEVNKEIDDDGWYYYQLHEDFAKLLRGWKWNNVALKNKKTIVLVSECEDTGINVMLFTRTNLHSGAIEIKGWFPDEFYNTIID